MTKPTWIVPCFKAASKMLFGCFSVAELYCCRTLAGDGHSWLIITRLRSTASAKCGHDARARVVHPQRSQIWPVCRHRHPAWRRCSNQRRRSRSAFKLLPPWALGSWESCRECKLWREVSPSRMMYWYRREWSECVLSVQKSQRQCMQSFCVLCTVLSKWSLAKNFVTNDYYWESEVQPEMESWVLMHGRSKIH